MHGIDCERYYNVQRGPVSLHRNKAMTSCFILGILCCSVWYSNQIRFRGESLTVRFRLVANVRHVFPHLVLANLVKTNSPTRLRIYGK